MRPLRPGPVLLAALALGALAGGTLTGCASIAAGQAAASTRAAGSTATAAPAPDPAVPLTCADLVPESLVASALAPASGTPAAAAESDSTPQPAVQPNALFDAAVLEGLGGLDCSWRLGDPQAAIGSGLGDWSYLSLRVLPGAADRWVPVWAGDAPSEDVRDIGGVEASTAAGETGWRLSAPVAGAWVQFEITAAGLTGTGSKYAGISDGTMLDRLAAVAEPVFAALESATPEQAAWPRLELAPVEPTCTGDLDVALLLVYLGYPADTAVSYRARTPDAVAASLDDAIRADARVFTCVLLAGGHGVSEIAVARGFAPESGVLDAPDGDVALDPLALPPGGDARAFIGPAMPNGGRTPVYLAAGGDLYEIWSDRSSAIADGIVDARW
ncbi:hypothetical protein ET445_05745 [Agromyces protaetiae]|uniref:DUF3558 domain-containing protein n=1 Tax=Agromyces protaetiae TaxID=2509455 RepID=A0A4P6FEW1_9MICO|nr:hypothetical protein [Agromyces protaetiae]QAY72919.1 hypothetical protein ET445_05745 [Agromyces protaetiae]